MTQLLEQAIERARQLPPDRQDAVARLLIEEIDASKTWDDALDHSEDKLEQLAQRALDSHREGKTVQKGWDEL